MSFPADQAVALQYRKSKLLLEGSRRFARELLRTGKQQSNAGKSLRLAVLQLQVSTEKCRRRRQQCDMIFLDQFGILQCIGRSRVRYDSDPLY